jgi:hypothetical protein
MTDEEVSAICQSAPRELSEEFVRLMEARDPRVIWRDCFGHIVPPPPRVPDPD